MNWTLRFSTYPDLPYSEHLLTSGGLRFSALHECSIFVASFSVFIMKFLIIFDIIYHKKIFEYSTN